MNTKWDILIFVRSANQAFFDFYKDATNVECNFGVLQFLDSEGIIHRTSAPWELRRRAATAPNEKE